MSIFVHQIRNQYALAITIIMQKLEGSCTSEPASGARAISSTSDTLRRCCCLETAKVGAMATVVSSILREPNCNSSPVILVLDFRLGWDYCISRTNGTSFGSYLKPTSGQVTAERYNVLR